MNVRKPFHEFASRAFREYLLYLAGGFCSQSIAAPSACIEVALPGSERLANYLSVCLPLILDVSRRNLLASYQVEEKSAEAEPSSNQASDTSITQVRAKMSKSTRSSQDPKGSTSQRVIEESQSHTFQYIKYDIIGASKLHIKPILSARLISADIYDISASAEAILYIRYYWMGPAYTICDIVG